MYQPFHIGERFRIVPPCTAPEADRTDIVMARGAFGSGEHETTADCIERMEALDWTGKRFLDLGSGTGILAIAAIRLGAASGLCVDVHADAVQSARHNSRLNGMDEELEHLCGTLDDVVETQFDIILANIYGDILLDICDDLVARAKPGADLLLSGILWEYNFDIRNRYKKAGCNVIGNRLLEEFSSVLLKKT